MFTVHRLVSHSEMKYETMVIVDKIKDKVTGGECTILDEPLLFNFNNGNGFKCSHIDPLRDLRKHKPEQMRIDDRALRNFRKSNNEFNVF